jgi:hypothetical protein
MKARPKRLLIDMKDLELIMEAWRKFKNTKHPTQLNEFDHSLARSTGGQPVRQDHPGRPAPTSEEVDAFIRDYLAPMGIVAVEILDAADIAASAVSIVASGGASIPVIIAKQGPKRILKAQLISALKRSNPKSVAKAFKNKFKPSPKQQKGAPLKRRDPVSVDSSRGSKLSDLDSTVPALRRQSNYGDSGKSPLSKAISKKQSNDPALAQTVDMPSSTPAPRIKLRKPKVKDPKTRQDPPPNISPEKKVKDLKTRQDPPPNIPRRVKKRSTEPQGSK